MLWNILANYHGNYFAIAECSKFRYDIMLKCLCYAPNILSLWVKISFSIATANIFILLSTLSTETKRDAEIQFDAIARLENKCQLALLSVVSFHGERHWESWVASIWFQYVWYSNFNIGKIGAKCNPSHAFAHLLFILLWEWLCFEFLICR